MKKKLSKIVEKTNEQNISIEDDKKSIQNNSLSSLIFGAFIVLFIFVWAVPFDEVQDDWKVAVLKVDSSRKVTNPELKMKLYNEGGESLKNLLREHLYHARLHFMLGFYYYVGENYDSALISLRKAIEIDSGGLMNSVTPEAQNLIGIIVLDKLKGIIGQGDFQFAYDFLKPYEYLKYQSLDIVLQFAIIYHGLGELDSAIRYYQIVLKNKPDLEQARHNLGLIYLNKANQMNQKEMLGVAIDYYQEAISLGVKNAISLANYALVLYKSGKYYESLNYFREALNYDRKNKSIIQSLAAVYNKIGMKDSALYYLNQLKALQ